MTTNDVYSTHICPVIVSKEFSRNWELCDNPAPYLVQGTLLCRVHAMYSDIQKRYEDMACGTMGKDSHVVEYGQHRCLCDAQQKSLY